MSDAGTPGPIESAIDSAATTAWLVVDTRAYSGSAAQWVALHVIRATDIDRQRLSGHPAGCPCSGLGGCGVRAALAETYLPQVAP